MGLVQEIEDAAVDASTDVSVVLRKCLLLASRIELPELRTWAEHELNGYPKDADLPPYRVLDAEPKGNFAGGIPAIGISQLTDTPIPLTALPEDFREQFRHVRLHQPISDIEEMVEQGRKGEGSTLSSPWPADFVQTYCSGIYVNMECLSAWSSFSVGQLRSVVETVRNRILSFVLELPDLADERRTSEQETKQQVAQIFSTTIMGNVSTWNTAGGDISQTVINVPQGDWQQLESVLGKAGISGESLQELKTAIQEDDPPEDGGFGSSVQAWLGRRLSEAADGSWEVSVAAAGQILGQALSSYFGLGGA